MSSPVQGVVELRVPPSTATEEELRITRRRVMLALGVVLVVLIGVIAAVSLGGGSAGPPEGAAAVVPADALAYVHVSTDSDSASVKRALGLLARLPSFAGTGSSITARLAAVIGNSNATDFRSQIRPWLGREAGLAFLDTASAAAQSLLVLDVTDRERARAFLIRAGATSAGSYRGVPVLRYASGTELAFEQHYLVLGQDASVRASIDVVSGGAPSIAGDSAYKRALDGQPADRVLEAYASGSGVRRVLGAQGGVIGALAPLLFSPSLAGVSAAVSTQGQGAALRVHSVLDPDLARISHRSITNFSPTLTRLIPAGSPFMLDLAGLDRAAPQLLNVLAAAGIGAQVRPLLARLGSALGAEGVSVKGLTSLFHAETAVAVTPSPNLLRPPSLTIVSRTADPSGAGERLASLQTPLTQLFSAPAEGAGQAPVFNDRPVAGVTAHQLSLTPGVELDYAVFNHLVVLSTSLDGIAAVAGHRRGISADPEFIVATHGRPNRVGSLLFLDFSQLLSLGEQTGISRGGRLAALLPDLQRIHAVGLSSTSGEDDSTAELTLQIP